jgi:hypothetical protein
MIALGIILLIGLAGYAGLPAWLVLLAAAGLTLQDWWAKLLLLLQQPGEVWRAKVDPVTGVIRDLCFTALPIHVGGARFSGERAPCTRAGR